MSWKHGAALIAATAFTLSFGALNAQEQQIERDKDQPRAAQDRDDDAAQPATQPRVQQRRGGAGIQARRGQMMSQRIDHSVAAMLALGNFEEIQLSQLASQKAQNPQVKEFAQTMVQDHTQFMEKLQPFLPPGFADDLRTSEGSPAGARSPGGRTDGAAGATRATQGDATQPGAALRPGAAAQPGAAPRPDQPNAAAQPRPGQPAAAQPQPTPPRVGQQGRPAEAGQVAGQEPGQEPGQWGGGPLLQIQKDAARRCLQMTREILNEHQGSDFDMAYMGHQITAHVTMLAKLEASQDHVSPEFQQVIREGHQKTEQHLKEARTIARALEGSQREGVQRQRSEGEGAQREERSSRPGRATPEAPRPQN